MLSCVSVTIGFVLLLLMLRRKHFGNNDVHLRFIFRHHYNIVQHLCIDSKLTVEGGVGHST